MGITAPGRKERSIGEDYQIIKSTKERMREKVLRSERKTGRE